MAEDNNHKLLRVEGLSCSYALPRSWPWLPRRRLPVLDGISFEIASGRSLGIVGESGSGKSTLARTVMALHRPDAGRVLLKGRELHGLDAASLRRARADLQMVFQDPYGSLDPRMTVARIVAEPILARSGFTQAELAQRVREALEAVGLRVADMKRHPHEFSGGQRQRIAIARALVTRPKLIVMDEPVSALDVSIQAQVLNLLQELARWQNLSYLIISHDLAIVDHLCDEVLVLSQGRVIERGAPAEVFGQPREPYTQELVRAAAE
ncbi:ATP-binding cassette domain-containing protein [Pelomonas sp. KK5]|uniref:ATP-binding cassette domain-containing protein n=1 Tax=Pelomonas sp. KK5 TaxID=1855730 RepID=UPI001E31D757|nr:ATP-binding cassette domain-containing protein [Pelomonas sp. KK5]